FFTNPIVPAGRIPEGAPAFPAAEPVRPSPHVADADPLAGDAQVEWAKTSAVSLISHAGTERGYSLGTPAALSTKHVLALTNRGGGAAADLAEAARAVRDRVANTYATAIVPERGVVGVSL